MPTFDVGDFLTADALNAIADPPQVKLVKQDAQNIPSGTDTVITFGSGSTVTDTHGFHSEVTNNSRITPTVAGTYLCLASFFMAAVSGVSFPVLGILFDVNGSPLAPRNRAAGPNSNNFNSSIQGSITQEFNGTTDYLELLGYQVASSAATRATVGPSPGSYACTLTVVRIGPIAADY